MEKKVLYSLLSVIILIFAFSLTAFAEEYIFTTNTSFPVFYSSSIETVNADHNVYTAESMEDIQHLIDAGIVTYCEPMSYSELFDYTTDDPYYPQQVNLGQVYAPFAWNKGIFGDTVKVAVIDSGLYNAASDFTMSNIIRAKDYTSTSTLSGNNYCKDEIGHGSMVTGIIAAAHNTRGVTGIAPNVEIYVFKCFYLNEYGKQTARNSDIIAAIYEAIDTYDCDIINLSSGTINEYVFKDVADYAANQNVLLVAAAGNSGAQSGDTLFYPASYDTVIGVGSVSADGHRANHSQRNDLVDIMAPGEDIYSVRLGGYEQGSGTSFATPHVVAAAALAKSIYPELTAKEITTALYKTANPMTDRYSGHGSLNIQALLTYLYSKANPGLLVHSFSDTSAFTYYTPLDGFIAYFARYKNDILTDVKENGINVPIKEFSNYVFYVWKIGSLSPYMGDINKIEY